MDVLNRTGLSKVSIMGVPIHFFLLNLALVSIITALIFFPALSDFGHTVLGIDDIRYFLWLFWHYTESVDAGANPLFANEIFHPFGISLSQTPTVPFQALIYLILPASWGPFGKITFLQVLSYILGGIFSFALVYRFTKSAVSSFIGSILYNFSIYHFEKALHHFNYSMAFPFIPLFFLFYFDFLDNPRKIKSLVLLSLSLFLVSLNEVTVAVMIGFICFLDIFARYMAHSNLKIFTQKNMIVFGGAIIISLLAHEMLSLQSAPAVLIYTLPSIPFLAACLFTLNFQNAKKLEERYGYATNLLICSAPVIIYLFVLVLQPSYSVVLDQTITNVLSFTVPIDYLIFPSEFNQISNSILLPQLSAWSERGVFLGIPLVLIIIFSMLYPKLEKNEIYFRDFALLCLLFSFPLIGMDKYYVSTPFFVTPLFPLLPVLRVPARFMIFVLLFLSVLVGLLVKKFMQNNGNQTTKKMFVLAFAVLLLAEQWPASAQFIFNQHIPQFYLNLSNSTQNESLFLYSSTIRYYTNLNEMYYQTIHGKVLSFGALSRFPNKGNPIYTFYGSLPGVSYSTLDTVSATNDAISIYKKYNYTYFILQKLTCSRECPYGTFTPINSDELATARSVLEPRLGQSIYEDESISVYTSQH